MVLWKTVVGFDKYEVSDEGHVRHQKFKKPRKYHLVKGYPFISLKDHQGRNHNRPVHRLVMEAFVGVRPVGLQTCHWDGNPQNNCLSNLRYDTRMANHLDAVRHGRVQAKKIRERRPQPVKYSNDVVREVCASSETAKEVAARLGVNVGYVYDLRKGRYRRAAA